MASGAPAKLEVPAPVPDTAATHKALAAVWARMKIADLVEQTSYAATPQMAGQIKQLALDYALMSTFTAFIAVDTTSSTDPTEATSEPSASSRSSHNHQHQTPED